VDITKNVIFNPVLVTFKRLKITNFVTLHTLKVIFRTQTVTFRTKLVILNLEKPSKDAVFRYPKTM
jgi:hypothetical protein